MKKGFSEKCIVCESVIQHAIGFVMGSKPQCQLCYNRGNPINPLWNIQFTNAFSRFALKGPCIGETSDSFVLYFEMDKHIGYIVRYNENVLVRCVQCADACPLMEREAAALKTLALRPDFMAWIKSKLPPDYKTGGCAFEFFDVFGMKQVSPGIWVGGKSAK